jgi:hypothetical protein
VSAHNKYLDVSWYLFENNNNKIIDINLSADWLSTVIISNYTLRTTDCKKNHEPRFHLISILESSHRLSDYKLWKDLTQTRPESAVWFSSELQYPADWCPLRSRVLTRAATSCTSCSCSRRTNLNSVPRTKLYLFRIK